MPYNITLGYPAVNMALSTIKIPKGKLLVGMTSICTQS